MRFKKIPPSPLLQSFVQHFWLLTVDEEDIPFSKLFFPFGSFELIVNLANAPSMQLAGNEEMLLQPAGLFPGQFTRPFVLSYTTGFRSVGISLQPWAGNLLFNIPAQHFTDRITCLTDLDKGSELTDRLRNAAGEAAIVQHLESYLLEKLKHYEVDTVATGIAKAILDNPSAKAYKDIVASIGCTRRRMEQRFLEATGLPMGSFVRKIRFQKAVNILRSQTQASLTRTGLEAGYYDQSHFIRAFKEFAGVTPKSFLKQHAEINSNISGLMMAPALV